MKTKGSNKTKEPKPEMLAVEKSFFLKAMEMLQAHEVILQKMYAQRQDNLGFEVGYIDENTLDTAARYVRTTTFMRQMKELFTLHHVSRLTGSFDLVNNRNAQEEKDPIKKVVESGR